MCLGSFDTFFFVDCTDGCLFKARLHNPVELELLVDELAKPTGVTYTKGVVNVAEESAGTYVDVGGVEAETKKTPIGGEAKQERVIGEWEKKLTVSQMKGRLSLWMNENVRSIGKARASEILIDGLSPMPLVSDEKMEGLFVSQSKCDFESGGQIQRSSPRSTNRGLCKSPWECLCDRTGHKQPNGGPLCGRF